jgi:hypothetical protein
VVGMTAKSCGQKPAGPPGRQKSKASKHRHRRAKSPLQGRRTGVVAVDRPTIAAHNRFQDIVDETNRGGYTFNVVTIGKDIPDKPTKTVVVNPNYAGILGDPTDSESGSAETSASAGGTP